jgi:hypothetical protein
VRAHHALRREPRRICQTIKGHLRTAILRSSMMPGQPSRLSGPAGSGNAFRVPVGEPARGAHVGAARVDRSALGRALIGRDSRIRRCLSGGGADGTHAREGCCGEGEPKQSSYTHGFLLSRAPGSVLRDDRAYARDGLLLRMGDAEQTRESWRGAPQPLRHWTGRREKTSIPVAFPTELHFHGHC